MRVRWVPVVLFLASAAGCASQSSTKPVEYLDPRTAMTIASLKQPIELVGEHVGIFGKIRFSDAQEGARTIIDRYAKGEVDAVDFIYNEFKSVMAQRLIVERYLPIKPFPGPKNPPVCYNLK